MSSDQAENLRRQAELLAQEHTPAPGGNYCRVLAVTGGKGGVGKTNIAVNLSLALCEAGARTLLLDADLGLADADVLLGLNPQLTLQHLIFGTATLEQVMLEGPLGLKLLPGGTGLPELANLSTLDIVRLLATLRNLERELHFLVIDTAAGISSTVLRFTAVAHDIVIVTTPEPAAMLDAYGMLKALHIKQARGKTHLLINMARSVADARDAFRSLAFVSRRYLDLELNYLGSLPIDEAVTHSIKRQRPFLLAQPQSPAARRLREVAGRFLEAPAVPPAQRESFFARLLSDMR